MLNFLTTENMCRFLWHSYQLPTFCGSSLFVGSFELFRVLLSRSLNRDKENITLENNNVLENFAENSLNNMNCF